MAGAHVLLHSPPVVYTVYSITAASLVPGMRVIEAKKRSIRSMNRCLRIIIIAQFPDDFLQAVLKAAKKLELEGTIQLIDPLAQQIKIIACGENTSLDDFIDFLHEKTAKLEFVSFEIEPFLKDKDYRAVFRIIEK